MYYNHRVVMATATRLGKRTVLSAGHTSGAVIAPPLDLQVGPEPVIRIRHRLRVKPVAEGLELTVEMPREDYVASVLAGEASLLPPEAAKAMAVAARSYSFRFAGAHRREGFDYCDTTHCQDARFDEWPAAVTKAVEQTESEMLWWKGSAAAAYYSKNCGGAVEAAANVWPDQAAPYLVAHPDPYCPRGNWSADLPKEKLRALPGIRAGSVAVVGRLASGRVTRLRVEGRVVQASFFRLSVGRSMGWNLVRSDWYEITDRGPVVHFEGRGAGHGVGLCQEGAAAMARAGKDYRAILAFYFPGARLGVTAQGLAWSRLGGERVEILTTQPSGDRALLALADRLAGEVEQRLGLRFASLVTLRSYPNVSVFRDSTGEPGWVAASTRSGVIRLQPAGKTPAVLRHELVHAAVEAHGHVSLPRWFREGVTLCLDGSAPGAGPGFAASDREFDSEDPAVRRRAYHGAKAAVAALIARRGEAEVLSWIPRGLPPPVATQARPESTRPPSR